MDKKEWKYGVPVLHSDENLRKDLYHIFEDCRQAGCIIDIWINDIQQILQKHGYDMKVYLKDK